MIATIHYICGQIALHSQIELDLIVFKTLADSCPQKCFITLQGSYIYAVGIDQGANKRQQQILAGDSGRAYDIKSFDELDADFTNIIANDVCEDANITFGEIFCFCTLSVAL